MKRVVDPKILLPVVRDIKESAIETSLKQSGRKVYTKICACGCKVSFQTYWKNTRYQKNHYRAVGEASPRWKGGLAAMQARRREKSLKYHREYMARARAKNPEHARKIYRQWADNNKDRIVKYAHDQRARKASAPGRGFTISDWEETLELYGYSCAYCGTTGIKLQQEHIDPLIKGGAHDPDNIAPSCGTCNSSKKDRILIIWLATRR